MAKVQIKNAQFYSQIISGVFEYIGTYHNGRIKIWYPEKNKHIVVKVDSENLKYVSEAEEFDYEQTWEVIEERFQVLDELVGGVIKGNILSLIVAGAAGVGKSYGATKALRRAVRDGDINSVEFLKGRVTGIGLYQTLWENQEPGQVLVLDDIDSVFKDENALNLLKAALDTSDERVISWATQNKSLEDQGIPNSFEYRGQIVFITNLNFDKMIEKDSGMSPHYQALLSRSIYLDLAVHKRREILVRIEQVVRSSNLLSSVDLNQDEQQALLEWINKNAFAMRELSLRTVTKLAGIIRSSENWERVAAITLLK